jgi:hypothetical protein
MVQGLGYGVPPCLGPKKFFANFVYRAKLGERRNFYRRHGDTDLNLGFRVQGLEFRV